MYEVLTSWYLCKIWFKCGESYGGCSGQGPVSWHFHVSTVLEVSHGCKTMAEETSFIVVRLLFDVWKWSCCGFHIKTYQPIMHSCVEIKPLQRRKEKNKKTIQKLSHCNLRGLRVLCREAKNRIKLENIMTLICYFLSSKKIPSDRIEFQEVIRAEKPQTLLWLSFKIWPLIHKWHQPTHIYNLIFSLLLSQEEHIFLFASLYLLLSLSLSLSLSASWPISTPSF